MTRRRALTLALGVTLWLAAAVLTPGELHAAKRREPIRARTVVTLVAYLAAAIAVLSGLPPAQNVTDNAKVDPPGTGAAPNDTRGAGA